VATDSQVDTNSVNTDFSIERIEKETEPLSPTTFDSSQTQIDVVLFDSGDSSHETSPAGEEREELIWQSTMLDLTGHMRRPLPANEPLQEINNRSPVGHTNSWSPLSPNTQSTSKEGWGSNSTPEREEEVSDVDRSLFWSITLTTQPTPSTTDEHGRLSKETITGRESWEWVSFRSTFKLPLKLRLVVVGWISDTESCKGYRRPDDSSMAVRGLVDFNDSKLVCGMNKRPEDKEAVGDDEREKEEDREFGVMLETGYWSSDMSEVTNLPYTLNKELNKDALSTPSDDRPDTHISTTFSIPESDKSSIDKPRSREIVKISSVNEVISFFEDTLKLE
jgi:hypothetical protein